MERQRVFNRIAVLGNYPPRQCGIATFTADLTNALSAQHGEGAVLTLAMNEAARGYDYPTRVRFEIDQDDLLQYHRAADFLNLQNTDVLSVQHEYGIFGGPAGSHLLTLLRELSVPVVTTLHTVLEHPNAQQRKVMEELCARSERLVVMSELGKTFLRNIYGVPEGKLDLIPHGVPDMPFTDPNFYKDGFGVEGKTVLLTFGLLSPNKGIEHVIRALPQVVAHHPEVVYLVVGATHPNLKRVDGESYRLSLQRLARSLGVEAHVAFYDRFVSLEELLAFIGAADLYLTPYNNREQITSGTLAYALGAGKAVVSTPYWYAEELLADGRGRLIPFGDPGALAETVCNLLDNEAEGHATRKRAYLYGRHMIWSEVAERYTESFSRARERWAGARTPVALPRTLGAEPTATELPPLDLRHLVRLTDDTGILQHARSTVPNYHEGYTTDDNARALIASVLLESLGESLDTRLDTQELGTRYLAFLNYAFDAPTGRFRNFLAFDRHWLEAVGSEDAHGRALWALGTVLGGSCREGLRGIAGHLFEAALPATASFTSPRAWAFTLLGLHAYRQLFAGDRTAHALQTALAERLIAQFEAQNTPGWPWPEPILSYCNAKLPHALLSAGHDLGRQEMVALGLEALRWLISEQKQNGHLSFVGCNGFYVKGSPRAAFDQQPVEAHAVVSACLEAYRITGEPAWRKEAFCAFEWFLGENDLGIPLYDPRSGGCCDGLQPDRVNQNQGAESTLAFLLSLLELRFSEEVTEVGEPRSLATV